MNERILEIRSLRKEFGGVVAVKDLDLSVDRGSITALIGPNGAGKTTVFHMITGFLRPTRGDITFDGVALQGRPVYTIAEMAIARTFQNVQIFSNMSALENVMVGRHLRSRSGFLGSLLVPPFFRREEKEIRKAAARWLEFVGLGDLARLPAGSLPLGSQRMLEIARALAMEPKMILLDEPASGLNARETVAMGELVREIREMGITVVLVEHDMELVMDISDQVNVINFGSLIARGTPREIQANPEVIAAYLGE
ncbi:ABC transporter ATP-binding protein [Desulfosudis oleivorans]|uniref:ABC transporter-related protein n=1 Tax=Desulfosudis oleivorans (strain DSM 6200 / JCM 39069 / Hxd3) TaxID=96561 RepID=A8ZVT7_DESOH|nr:ABC transporter ATP-binding protein [Desulfosudis oleivorans]ABW66646.1 ABC transporter-related protein [Desulfosudis oleivorans Hxd3]